MKTKKTVALIVMILLMLTLSVPAFAANGPLSVEQAKQAALNYSGVRASEAVFTKAYRTYDDGREVYEIEFFAGNVEYDMDVDVYTGRITDFSREMHMTAHPAPAAPGFYRYDDYDDRYDFD